MQVILQGSLRQFPLGELLAFVSAHVGATTIEIEAKPARARLVLEDHRLVWADSSQESDPRAILRDTATWTAGNFRVLESAVLPDGARAFSMDLAPLVEELAKIRSESAVFDPDASFLVGDEEKVEQVTLEPEELKLLLRIGRGKNFAQLSEGREPRDVSRMIRKLISLGLVSVAAAETPVDASLDDTQEQPRKNTFELSGSLTSTGADGLAYALIEDDQTVGRDENNAVSLPDSSVSSKHARLTRGEDGFYIEDLKSRNGTYVNGERITERRLLADNDVLRFGKIVMTFNVAREFVRGRTTARGNGS